MLPLGKKYLEKQLQFVHVDDVARLLVYLLHRPETDPPMTILNVAGRGEPITIQRCAEIANATDQARSACRLSSDSAVACGSGESRPFLPLLCLT